MSADPLFDAPSLADEILEAAPIAVQETLHTLRRGQEDGFETAMLREAQAQAITYPTEDLAEGVKALQEKRQPQFKGK